MDPRWVEAILHENWQLRERIAVLEGLLMDVQPLPVEWRLTPAEARVFGVLVNRDLATKETIHHALYGLDPNGGAEMKIVDVHICKIRRKLKPFGITIETRFGQGYLLPEPIRARIRVTPAPPPARSPIAAAA